MFSLFSSLSLFSFSLPFVIIYFYFASFVFLPPPSFYRYIGKIYASYMLEFHEANKDIGVGREWGENVL